MITLKLNLKIVNNVDTSGCQKSLNNYCNAFTIMEIINLFSVNVDFFKFSCP